MILSGTKFGFGISKNDIKVGRNIYTLILFELAKAPNTIGLSLRGLNWVMACVGTLSLYINVSWTVFLRNFKVNEILSNWPLSSVDKNSKYFFSDK